MKIQSLPFLAELKSPDGDLQPNRRGPANGGKRIGQLERALILPRATHTSGKPFDRQP